MITSPAALQQLITGLAIQAPMFLVSLAGVIVAIVKWREAPSAALWALLGFGLSLVLCFAIPIGQAAISAAMTNSGRAVAQIAGYYTILACVWSIARAASYGLLIAAVFAGRSGEQQTYNA